ncbi:MAG: divalent-cation tolerance protein CutA [Alphaproteobacteria bacterium]|nr:divalent-cation tolerance protein CutA [Alphaproteobacteria bacterium]MCL2505023.1 divalent-cation tolerance protein CutA [Alphaproteobacteria bacterium]
MKEIIFVYITFPSLKEATDVAEVLVAEDLIACANLIPKIFSIYKWEGKVNNSEEAVLIAKTAADKWNALEKRVKELHSYTCPCIVAMPVTKGNPDFLNWVCS